MNEREYEVMFRVEDAYWWYRGMRKVQRALAPAFFASGRSGRMLDAGCGTGRNLVDLATAGPAVGVDVSLRALSFARRRRAAPLVCGSVEALPFRDGAFAGALSRDVLYMVSHDARAARELGRVLAPGGGLLLSSPAFESLRGAHDVAVGTLRRYRTGDLEILLKKAGLAVGRATYANFFLATPIFFLRRWTGAMARGRPRGEVASDFALSRSFPLEGILFSVLSFEAALVGIGLRLPWGVTAFVVASKPDQRAVPDASVAAGTSVAGK